MIIRYYSIDTKSLETERAAILNYLNNLLGIKKPPKISNNAIPVYTKIRLRVFVINNDPEN